MTTRTTRPFIERAKRLLTLEQRDAEISAILHRLTREREENRAEALTLRMSLTIEERRTYEACRLT